LNNLIALHAQSVKEAHGCYREVIKHNTKSGDAPDMLVNHWDEYKDVCELFGRCFTTQAPKNKYDSSLDAHGSSPSSSSSSHTSIAARRATGGAKDGACGLTTCTTSSTSSTTSNGGNDKDEDGEVLAWFLCLFLHIYTHPHTHTRKYHSLLNPKKRLNAKPTYINYTHTREGRGRDRKEEKAAHQQKEEKKRKAATLLSQFSSCYFNLLPSY
jgi:hypothetical protein